MSESLHFAEHTLQEAALAFMGLVYLARLLWLFRRFRAGRDRQPPTGRPGTGAMRGIRGWCSGSRGRSGSRFWSGFCG